MQKKLWVWLSLLFGANSYIYKKLLTHFGSIERIYDSDDADVNLIDWLSPSDKYKLLDKSLKNAENILETCQYIDANILTPSDSEYPQSLMEIDRIPAVLYYKGRLPDFNKNLFVSVVGTRKFTQDGKRNAYTLGYGLAKGGAIVVSGMALGVDSTAQKGALYAGGTSVAVLGCGIDVVYPRENYKLMQKLISVGTVITEYPPNTPPNGFQFPQRNRIISALSRAVVVVECPSNSGALITAKMAMEQGKDLFAFPGSVNSYVSDGNNQLLREGARMATSAIDVLEQYMDEYAFINLSASKERPVLPKSNSNAETFNANNDRKNKDTKQEEMIKKQE